MSTNKTHLTIEDLQNIHACLKLARVEGIDAAVKLVLLHEKVGLILQAETNGDRNGTDSVESRSGESAAEPDHIDAGN